MVDERRLDRVQMLALGDALDRGDLAAGVHHGERHAGEDPPAADVHRAGSALAPIAALFRPRQLEAFAQRVEQRHSRVDRHRVRLPVDGERDVHRAQQDGGRLVNQPSV